MTHPAYPVFVAQYYNGHDSRGLRRYTWAIIIHEGKDHHGNYFGTSYALCGSIAQGWQLSIRPIYYYRKHSSYRGCIRVGDLPVRDYKNMDMLLKSTQIVQHDPQWDYQTWVANALRKLYAYGFDVDEHLWLRLWDDMAEAEREWNKDRDLDPFAYRERRADREARLVREREAQQQQSLRRFF